MYPYILDGRYFGSINCPNKSKLYDMKKHYSIFNT